MRSFGQSFVDSSFSFCMKLLSYYFKNPPLPSFLLSLSLHDCYHLIYGSDLVIPRLSIRFESVPSPLPFSLSLSLVSFSF